MEKSSGRCLVIHRQQEHNRDYEGGRSACVLARCLLSAFGVTALPTVGLCVAFQAPTSILAVSTDTVTASPGAIRHTRTGFVEQLSLYFILVTSPHIQTLIYFSTSMRRFVSHTQDSKSLALQCHVLPSPPHLSPLRPRWAREWT